MASFIEFCVNNNIAQPPDKIVKNLCTFLCQDVEQTPTFAYARSISTGILSFQATFKPTAQRSGRESAKEKNDVIQSDEVQARLSRCGAGLAFDQLSAKFGSRLLDVIPAMWQSMAGGLLSACMTGASSYPRCGPCVMLIYIYRLTRRVG